MENCVFPFREKVLKKPIMPTNSATKVIVFFELTNFFRQKMQKKHKKAFFFNKSQLFFLLFQKKVVPL